MPTLQFIDIFSYEMSIDNYNSTEATGIHPSTQMESDLNSNIYKP